MGKKGEGKGGEREGVTKSQEKEAGNSGLFLSIYFVPFTINAWITPGIQAKSVSNTLIKNVLPIPCFKKTARGGSKMFKIIVSSDIMNSFFGI
jgi:hypothetical protein